MEISTIVQVAVSIIAIILAYIALRENKLTRKASFKPVLIPGNYDDFKTDDRLFVYNFEYPPTEDVGSELLLAHLGLRNIGKGPAVNVTVCDFRIIENVTQNEHQEQTEDEGEFKLFRAGYQTTHIQEGYSIPFIIRAANEDATDCYSTIYSTTILFHDLFNSSFFLSLRLFIEGDQVVVLEYNDQKNPVWYEGYKAPFRKAESYGYYEMQEIKSRVSNVYKNEKA